MPRGKAMDTSSVLKTQVFVVIFFIYLVVVFIPFFTTSVIPLQVTEDMKELYHHKPERFQRRDLMRATWTTKHK